jgi:hypothetical protein
MQQGARKFGAHRTGSYNATLREKEAGLSAIAHSERIVGCIAGISRCSRTAVETKPTPIAGRALRRDCRIAQENYAARELAKTCPAESVAPVTALPVQAATESQSTLLFPCRLFLRRGIVQLGLTAPGLSWQSRPHVAPQARGYSLVVKHQPSKLAMRVRFPLPAPRPLTLISSCVASAASALTPKLAAAAPIFASTA